jgi:hypothetical protein
MEGMAEAAKMGIPITQVYETNMQGRLEDHLFEIEAERLLREGLQRVEDKEGYLSKLAEEMGVLEFVENVDSFEEKISLVCSSTRATLTGALFASFLKELYGKSKDLEALLLQLEEDIPWAGIYVTRRVYNIFFSRENRPKWITYLQEEFGVSEVQAKEIVSKIDMLPASKRRAEDTYRTLGGKSNLTNTEFPDHQVKVWKMSQSNFFELSRFEKSITEEPDVERLERLLKIEDFRKAYELTPELTRKLKQVGIEGNFGLGGIKPEEWSTYGPVVKTMKEFNTAYINFRQKAIDFVRKVAQKSERS